MPPKRRFARATDENKSQIRLLSVATGAMTVQADYRGRTLNTKIIRTEISLRLATVKSRFFQPIIMTKIAAHRCMNVHSGDHPLALIRS